MKGLVVTEYGEPDVLQWEDVPEPEPAAGELLIRVRAFAINWADLLQRAGRYPGGPEAPFVSGHDLVGEGVGRGPGTDGPPDGTRVFGFLGRNGAAAELATAPAKWFYPVPEGLSDEEAAGLAAPYLTADAAIVDLGRLQAGEAVLVHAAAGGYGSAAVQLARYYGAGTIIATAGSDDKLERVRSWGADVLVNYRTHDFVPAALEATDGRGVDLILESVGGDVLGASFDCIAPLGRLISVGASAGSSSKRFRLHTLFEKGILVGGFTLGLWAQHHPELIEPIGERLMEALESGQLQPAVGGVFTRDQSVEAHRFLGDRRSVGRTVVVM